jgi:hypothetical protein
MSDSPPSPRGLRRLISPFGAVTAVAVLGAGLLIAGYVTHQQGTPNRPADALTGRTAPAPTVPAPTSSAGPAPVAGVLTGSPAPTATKANGTGGNAVGTATAPISLRYTFDRGLGRAIADTDGRFPLRPISQNDGTLAFTPRDSGLAMQFPPRCRLDEQRCPRAILEGLRIDAFNPGTRPLSYGASVLMTREDLGDGANVMQKGYSVGGVSQFKLQVDHLAGHPSCVIAGPAKIYKAESDLDIADGTWHTVTCTRSGARLSIAVDGVDGGSVFVPPSLSIANAEPLRIGGKGANRGNDQFAGQIDDVHLTIS